MNSLYSFWWDVTNDWGLELLKPGGDTRGLPPRRLVLPHRHSGLPLLSPQSSGDTGSALSHQARHPWGLRAVLLYPSALYPILIFVNLILRMTWSIKLSSHLHSQSEASITVFTLEVAEILRRWLWVFLRVEWEAIRKSQEPKIIRAREEDSDYELIPTPERSTAV